MADNNSLPRGAICVTLLVPDTADGTSVVLSWVRWHLKVGFSHLFLFFDLPPAVVNESLTTGSGEFAPTTSSPVSDDASFNLPPRTSLPDHSAARAVIREFASVGSDATLGGGQDSTTAVTVIAGRAPEMVAWQALYCPSWRMLGSYAPNEVPARQCLNAETAAALCPSVECTWLMHLDIDELFYTGPPEAASDGSMVCPQVALHFASLESEGCEALTYMNHEGVPEKEAVGDYFQEVTLFRRHHFCTPLKPEAREAMAFWSQRTGHGQYLLVYDCGKSVAKVQPGLRAASVHTWALPPEEHPRPEQHQPPQRQRHQRKPRSRTALADPRALDVASLRLAEWPCVLHYPCCGLGWLSAKYRILGRFEASWAGLPIAPSFHLDARDAVLGKDEAFDKDGGDGATPFDSTSDENNGRKSCSSRSRNNSSIEDPVPSSVVNSTPTTPGAVTSNVEAACGRSNSKDSEARAFYRAQVLFDTGGAHALELDRQLKANVCMRLIHVTNALNPVTDDVSGNDSATATPTPPSQSSTSSSDKIVSDGARSKVAAPPPAAPINNNVATMTRAADALALVGAHLAAEDEGVRSRDDASATSGPVSSTAAANESSSATPADSKSATPATTVPGSKDLGCQKAWMLSSIAQQYL